ncbi:MAG: CGNR zinc finger domain-containing protein [Acidobacteriota bacterium]
MKRSEDWPGEKPAPDGLQHVVDFLNTVDPQTGDDALASATTLSAWLEEQGLLAPGSAFEAADYSAALAARAGLWALAADHSAAYREHAGDRDAIAQLATLAHSARLNVRFDAAGSARLAFETSSFAGVLGRLFAAVERAQLLDRWQRVKICANDACRRAFWDASNNRQAKWCSMRRCGSKLKARARREAWRRWR